MKNIDRFLIACLVTLFASCDSKEPSTTSVENSFVYIDTKKEDRKNDNSYNEMILYTFGHSPSINDFQSFCEEKKKDFTDGVFHMIIFFDNKENAKFPNNPVTGGFMEEDQLKHIKAAYTFNRLNGYSKLQYYEKNNWESKPNEIQID